MIRYLAVAAADGIVAGYLLAGDPAPWIPLAIIGSGAILVADAIAARAASHGRARQDGAAGDGWHEFYRELARARRHARPFALVRLPGAGRQASALERLRPLHRTTDRAWSSEDDVFVILPEADGSTAGELVDRIQEQEPWLLAEAPAVVAFPRDGLTSGALLAALYGQPLASVGAPHVVDPAAGEEPISIARQASG